VRDDSTAIFCSKRHLKKLNEKADFKVLTDKKEHGKVASVANFGL
jgi:hypothetical protein